MNRNDFRALARLRLREARALRDRSLWSGCYYLSGHAVECALKACIARSTKRYDFPEKKRVQDSHTHDLGALLKLAGLAATLPRDATAHPTIGLNWSVVKDWSVETRYNQSVTAQTALDLYRAAAGVISWLRQYW